MDVTAAVKLVNGLATMPGVTLEAHDYTNRYEDTISVKVTLTSGTNSDEAEAPNYSTPVPPDGPYATFTLYVGDADEHELVGRAIDLQLEAFAHEIREFTRTQRDGRWIAPFHPHKHPSILAWAARKGTDPNLDYYYGTA